MRRIAANRSQQRNDTTEHLKHPVQRQVRGAEPVVLTCVGQLVSEHPDASEAIEERALRVMA